MRPMNAECPVQLEATVDTIHPFGANNTRGHTATTAIEVRIERAHIDCSILMEDDRDRFDPDKWPPPIGNFRRSMVSAIACLRRD